MDEIEKMEREALIMEREALIWAREKLRKDSGFYLYPPINHIQPERSKREDPVLKMARLSGDLMKSWQDNVINEMGCGALNSMET